MKESIVCALALCWFITTGKAEDKHPWPLAGYTTLAELRVVHVSNMKESVTALPPGTEQSGYTHSFTCKEFVGLDSMYQSLTNLLSAAEPINEVQEDFRWGITVKGHDINGDWEEHLSVAYSPELCIAVLGKHFYKLDAKKAKDFLSRFNCVFGTSI